MNQTPSQQEPQNDAAAEPDSALPLIVVPGALLLVDLSAIFWWKWHASAGESIDAAYDYSVERVLGLSLDYDRIAICCDSGRSFRYDLAEDYKGNRPPRDPAAIAQIKRVQHELADRGFPIWSVPNFEADDIIASAVARAQELDPSPAVVIAGSDKDLFQLVGPGVFMYSLQTDTLFDADRVFDKLGVGPELIPDYLALVGDAADNVHGVPRVGAKRAAELLAKFGSGDAIFEALDVTDGKGAPRVTPVSVRHSLLNHRDTYRKALELVVLRRDVPIDFDALFRPRVARPTMFDDGVEDICDGPIDASDPLFAYAREYAEPEPMQAPKLVDENGVPTTAGVNAMFDAMDEARTSRVEPDPPSSAAIQDTQPPSEAPAPPAHHNGPNPTNETPMTTSTTTTANGTPPAQTNGHAHHAAEPSAPPAAALAPTAARRGSGGPRFSAAAVTTAPDQTAHRFILTGRSGVGKTFFASTIPGVFIIPIEEGLKGVSPDHNPAHFRNTPHTLRELHEAIDAFGREVNAVPDGGGPRPYKMLVLDSLTGVETLVHLQVCDAERVPHMEAKEFKKVWHAAEPEWDRLLARLDAIRRTGTHVMFIAHSSEIVDASSTTGEVYRKWDLALKGTGDVVATMRNKVRGWADHVFFIDWQVKVQKGTKGTRSIGKYEGRILYTRESATHYAKTRSPLPPLLPATWQDLASALRAGRVAPDNRLRAQIEEVAAQLPSSERDVVLDELANASPTSIAALLSRAQGLLAVAREDIAAIDAAAANETGAEFE